MGIMTPGPYIPMHTTLEASSFPNLAHQQSMADTNATSKTSFIDETETKKLKARNELLEKKVKAKDQLFEDALSSTVATCGVGQPENKSLIAELKRRFLKLKNKYNEAEAEITRLTKTVKIVEVEVHEDTEPLRQELQTLRDERFELQ